MLGFLGGAPEPPPNDGPDDGPDEWREGPGGLVGSKSGPHCSYCGSLHPQVFLDALAAGDVLEPTDKNYKAYVGGEKTGHDKFYYQHLSMEHRQRFADLYNERKMNLGVPGYFYVKPYFLHLVQPEPVDATND